MLNGNILVPANQGSPGKWQLKHTERVIVQFYCQTVGAGNRRFNVGVLFDRTTVDILTALQLTTLSAKLQET